MRRFLTVLAVVVAATFTSAAPAQAHTSYCGHYSKDRYISGVLYRDIFEDWYGVGTHYHVYRTFRWFYDSNARAWYWKFVHWHDARPCPNNHPV